MAARKLIILGGGDFCRELLWTLSLLESSNPGWISHGILDDAPDDTRERLRRYGVSLPVLGAIADHQPREEEVFISAIGAPKPKLRTAELIETRGGRFISVIHPTCQISPDAKLGNGLFLFANSIVSVGSVVEDFVSVNLGAIIGHDACVGRGCTLSPLAVLDGHAVLGRGVMMATLSAVLPGQRVEDFATVGAGSVAMQTVPAGVTVLGVPARAISPRHVR